MAQTPNTDPYDVLGVSRTAKDEDIKKAYRRLAKTLHPDLNPGDDAKQERFKAVSAAYDLLRDAEKRRRFDAGEIDATGAEAPRRQSYRSYAEADPSHRYETQGDFDDLGDIFARAFGQRGDTGGSMRMRGADSHFHMRITFLDAVNGVSRRMTLPDGGVLDVTIPPGIEDGQTLRLAGRGSAGMNGGPSGDALIRISVAADAVFTRLGEDIAMDLPVSVDEAVLGGAVEVPTPSGRVKLRIPAGSSSGRVMRLKGKGVKPGAGQAGDLLVTLKIVLPDTVDPALEQAIRNWRAGHSYDPRAGWKGDR